MTPVASRRVRAAVITVVATTLVATAAGAATAGAATAAGRDDIASVPIEFPVRVVNQGLTPCVGDAPAVDAVIRGTLTGPAEALERGEVAGAVLTHGNGYDESFYTFDDEDFDVVGDLARRGHVSVTYDRLGYGDSDRPDGNTVCIGTEATVLHQMITQLRAGSYRSEGPAPSFTRVASLGHSAGGFVVEQEAGRFRDVDALGAISTGLEAATPRVLQRAAEMQVRCGVPGTPLSAPGGYAGLEANAEEFRADHIVNVEERIARVLIENRTLDACGGTRNLQNIAANTPANATLQVPVLAVAGAEDAFFPRVQAHAATFAGSPAVTVESIPRTGHAIAFSREAPLFRDVVARWLAANGF